MILLVIGLVFLVAALVWQMTYGYPGQSQIPVAGRERRWQSPRRQFRLHGLSTLQNGLKMV